MHTVITILLAFVSLITLLLVIGLFMRKEHYVRRGIIINAPSHKVFDYIRLLRNQDEFNTNAMAGPGREKTYKGTDGTVGYVYAWSGSKEAGEGEKEILEIVEGKRIETEIRFTRPMVTSARVIMETEALPGGQTKVYWSNAGTLKYPINILIPTLQKSVARGMDASLANLKNMLEK